MSESEGGGREFAFTERDFRFLKDQAYAYAGIALSDQKQAMVYSRLARRIRQLGLSSMAEYCELLKSDYADEEQVHFINAITTNLTKFFREPHHYDHLAGVLRDYTQKRSTPEFRLWSAGCSRGMEVYSAAITLFDTWPSVSARDVVFLATDIDTRILQEAEQGVYTGEGVEALSSLHKSKYFTSHPRKEGTVQVVQKLRDLVHFRHLNFMHDWPMRHRFNVIFCRNVLIYFDRPTQQNILSRFAQKLIPGGTLYIGHSESIGEAARFFSYQGNTTYIRNDVP